MRASPALRAAAEAWEAAFLDLAAGNLSAMATEAGLRLSFSAERSVADELARESTADVATVWGWPHVLPLRLSTVPRLLRGLVPVGHSWNPHGIGLLITAPGMGLYLTICFPK